MQDAFNKYTYDSQNHMIASQSLSSGSLTCYFYDAYGRRVQKVDGATSCGYPISGGTLTGPTFCTSASERVYIR